MSKIGGYDVRNHDKADEQDIELLTYNLLITKGNKVTKETVTDTFKKVVKLVERHYNKGADAVEMELMEWKK
jgi:GTP cyclohydrolase I|tara:strand:- start:552 stop:767 length:216 start_codon:yes stop_codon:yes gene_type:complete